MSSNVNRNCSFLRDTTAKSIQNVDKELLIFLLNFYYKFSGKLLGFVGPTPDFQNLDLTTLSMKKMFIKIQEIHITLLSFSS